MAGFISFKTVSGYSEEIQYHVGERLLISLFDFDRIAEIQVDGHELQEILQKFVNLPHSKDSVNRWFGDTAKMIVAAIEDIGNGRHF